MDAARFARGSFVAALAWSSFASAQEAAAPPAAPQEKSQQPAAPASKPAPQKAPERPAAEAAAGAEEVRRDPKGITGISPFWEAVIQGDRSYIARDYDAAIAAYREAVTADPQNPMGHYRMAEAERAKGNLAEAEQSIQSGLRFAGNDQRMRAKLLFVLADLRERQQSWDDASARWTEYEKHATEQVDAKAFPQTAVERKKRIEDWKKLAADSAEVKKRSDARLKEAEESARKNAK